MTTTSAQLLDLVVQALKVPGATDAGSSVFRPGDWPVSDDRLPAIKARVVGEDKIATGRGEIAFTVTTTIRLLVEAAASSDVDGSGADSAEAQLWTINRQVEVTLINSYPLTFLLQQFPFIRSQLVFSADGEKHVGALQIDIGLEFFQGAEDFAPIKIDDLNEADVSITRLPPAGVKLDLTGQP